MFCRFTLRAFLINFFSLIFLIFAVCRFAKFPVNLKMQPIPLFRFLLSKCHSREFVKPSESVCVLNFMCPPKTVHKSLWFCGGDGLQSSHDDRRFPSGRGPLRGWTTGGCCPWALSRRPRPVKRNSRGVH